MPIRDFLKKKDKHGVSAPTSPEQPEFKIYRSDTHGTELISAPNFGGDPNTDGAVGSRGGKLFKSRNRSSSTTSHKSFDNVSERPTSSPSKGPSKRLSQRLGLRRDDTSESVPADLPEIVTGFKEGSEEGKESQWEKRATILARKNEETRSMPPTPSRSNANLDNFGDMRLGESQGHIGEHTVSSKKTDDNIQEAIRLHEAGDLVTATKMFGRLADPNGENNALSQVLYGLALRHGWGCTPDPAEAVKYLSAAASNAASIEDLALKAGLKKGGAAKGELVLAIFELANCFRHGWGVQVDKVAAKQYYETAANLGDTDAMNEVAWCYLEGFGCKKDKYAAARYYRKAEDAGSKTLGNTWIWKEKYNEE